MVKEVGQLFANIRVLRVSYEHDLVSGIKQVNLWYTVNGKEFSSNHVIEGDE